jgi:retron-type reverse transcriptase
MTQHEAEGLWERAIGRDNLMAALRRVQSNGGAPGVDGMTVEELPEHLRVHWPNIREKLEAAVCANVSETTPLKSLGYNGTSRGE